MSPADVVGVSKISLFSARRCLFLFLVRALLPGLLAAEPFALLPAVFPFIRLAALLAVLPEALDLALAMPQNVSNDI
jgi:hypothetical protein